MRTIILASGSPRRKQLLEEAGYRILVRIPDVQECQYDEDPERTVRENAAAKYGAIGNGQPETIVLAADTVLEFNGVCIGKPRTIREAKAIWRELSGHRHVVMTALASGRGGEPPSVDVERSMVTFKTLTEEEMDRYSESVNPLDKAGGYNIDEPGAAGLVQEYEGSYSNIMGLPIERVQARLKQLEG